MAAAGPAKLLRLANNKLENQGAEHRQEIDFAARRRNGTNYYVTRLV